MTAFFRQSILWGNSLVLHLCHIVLSLKTSILENVKLNTMPEREPIAKAIIG